MWISYYSFRPASRIRKCFLIPPPMQEWTNHTTSRAMRGPTFSYNLKADGIQLYGALPPPTKLECAWVNYLWNTVSLGCCHQGGDCVDSLSIRRSSGTVRKRNFHPTPPSIPPLAFHPEIYLSSFSFISCILHIYIIMCIYLYVFNTFLFFVVLMYSPWDWVCTSTSKKYI